MNRRDAITIQTHEDQWDNAGLLTALYKITDRREIVFDDQPQFGDRIFFIEPSKITNELFEFSKDFNWLRNANGQSGNKKLYLNGEILTTDNYRTPVYVESEDEGMILDHYEFADWNLITDVAPVIVNDMETSQQYVKL